jgi:hypothetical protein
MYNMCGDWGIIGHVTVASGNTVGTAGAPPHIVN